MKIKGIEINKTRIDHPQVIGERAAFGGIAIGFIHAVVARTQAFYVVFQANVPVMNSPVVIKNVVFNNNVSNVAQLYTASAYTTPMSEDVTDNYERIHYFCHVIRSNPQRGVSRIMHDEEVVPESQATDTAFFL